ncbi:hypothetical protein [Paenibacillus cucumis (ex Kampfer et al. 2016)]|uniref:Nucleoside 2-deoxyribosyltransferase n=1 Tax=Paenibacillus cucumis (ex Kampfer et al. 2016) TaxID=1776858 RepID=A0ABS7KJV5_9BACL|nr:hypothetical protein [Paenibacillus cucumis (ex Kampfer et al. 2016)]MBY0204437.1 hypothetical protein [Paenibacillus cucumis (ex Kampfer et al. 2016)]
MNNYYFSFPIDKSRAQKAIEIIRVFYAHPFPIGIVIYQDSYEITQKLGRKYDTVLQTRMLPFKELTTRTGQVDCFIIQNAHEIEFFVQHEGCAVNVIVFDPLPDGERAIKYGFRIFENVEYYEFSIAGLEEAQFQELAMELNRIHGVEQLHED